jgi:hypothetical protein
VAPYSLCRAASGSLLQLLYIFFKIAKRLIEGREETVKIVCGGLLVHKNLLE